MNLCCKCIHYASRGMAPGGPVCMRRHHFGTDPVDGWRTIPRGAPLCHVERDVGGACGPEGKLFQRPPHPALRAMRNWMLGRTA